MQLFPERPKRYGGRLFAIAVLLSVLLHVAVGTIWALYGRRIVTVVSKVVPRPTPTPEIVALSDAIRIEKRTVPRVSHRARPRPRRAQQRPTPRNPAALAAAIPVPTLPPLPTPVPTATPAPAPAPTFRAQRATIHRPLAQRTSPPRPQPTVEPTRNAFTPEQIAALNAQFKRTIDSAQRALTEMPRQGGVSEVRPQREPPSVQRQRFQQIMAGTPSQFLAAQGDCVPLQGPMVSGAVRAYYIRCFIRYSDGYFEQVSFPWPFRFNRRNDPFLYAPGTITFPMQAPPDGLTLPHPFALSRAVCTFYRAECSAVVDAEIRRGDPSYGKPP